MSRMLWSKRAALLACTQNTQPSGQFVFQACANSIASCDFLCPCKHVYQARLRSTLPDTTETIERESTPGSRQSLAYLIAE
jgi:hypothetical protein